jgi:hypothetical protein
MGKDFFWDEEFSMKGFVSVTPGVATSLHDQHNWTIPRGTWTHRRTLFGGLGPSGPGSVHPQRSHTTRTEGNNRTLLGGPEILITMLNDNESFEVPCKLCLMRTDK